MSRTTVAFITTRQIRTDPIDASIGKLITFIDINTSPIDRIVSKSTMAPTLKTSFTIETVSMSTARIIQTLILVDTSSRSEFEAPFTSAGVASVLIHALSAISTGSGLALVNVHAGVAAVRQLETLEADALMASHGVDAVAVDAGVAEAALVDVHAGPVLELKSMTTLAFKRAGKISAKSSFSTSLLVQTLIHINALLIGYLKSLMAMTPK